MFTRLASTCLAAALLGISLASAHAQSAQPEGLQGLDQQELQRDRNFYSDGQWRGQIDKKGNIYDNRGNFIGTVDRNGNIYGTDGTFKGKVDKRGDVRMLPEGQDYSPPQGYVD